MEAKKQEVLKREFEELVAEREQEEPAESKRPKLELPALAAEPAEEAESAETAAETAAEAAEAAAILDSEKEVEEGVEQALVLTNILSRGESVLSTSSLVYR